MISQMKHPNIYVVDDLWQFPAITEKHAYQQISKFDGLGPDFAFVAFPWATLFDLIDRKVERADDLEKRIQREADSISDRVTRVTVCQHIKMLKHIEHLKDAKIDCVFWSHADHNASQLSIEHGIEIRPFPLYPVQLSSLDIEDERDRPYLFSFVGAKANQWYLTQVRTWILEELSDHPKGMIVGRDSWHYNKIVYDHQIKNGGGDTPDLSNEKSSTEFRNILDRSVFALCPSGTGPNSIRFWEALGAGVIPVLLSDQILLPGDQLLWESAIVRCDETREAVRELPERLQNIASDHAKLDGMRTACRQLWLLYGRDLFVTDIIELSLKGAEREVTEPETTPISGILGKLLEKQRSGAHMNMEDYRLALMSGTSRLLSSLTTSIQPLKNDRDMQALLTRARTEISDHNNIVRLFDRAQKIASAKLVPSPYINRGVGPTVCLYGPHSHRTPLSYPAYQALIGNRLSLTKDPEKADLVVTGYVQDLIQDTEAYSNLIAKKSKRRLVVLSEEPLWDTIWSHGFENKNRVIKDLPFTFLNHVTTDIYKFANIPYFITTDDSYLTRYLMLFSNNISLSPKDWLERWSKAMTNIAFFFEKRENQEYDRSWPERDIYGLSSYRTKIAQSLDSKDNLTVGRGWNSEKPRQKLIDWHLDKLMNLDAKTRIVSAFENTHHENYITEKIFDAFAVGGIPIYFASSLHRVHDFLTHGGFINLFNQTPEEACQTLSRFVPDADFSHKYWATQLQLRRLFCTPRILQDERNHVLSKLTKELSALCD